MKIVASATVADAYGSRMRHLAPRAKLIVPSVAGDALIWRGDPTAPDVCCLSAGRERCLGFGALMIVAFRSAKGDSFAERKAILRRLLMCRS